METIELTPGIWMLRFPVGQAYAIRLADGFALVDTGVAGAEEAILDTLRDLGARHPADLREIVLTHCHHDHTGSAAALAAATGARVLAGAADAPVIRGDAPQPAPVLQEAWEKALYDAVAPGVPTAPPAPVHREVSDGEELDTWGIPARVLHVPGHTPGSIAVHLPGARALFTGDTVAEHGGEVIPGVFNTDRGQLAASLRRLAGLDVDLAAFGHGDPLLTGAAAALRGIAG